MLNLAELVALRPDLGGLKKVVYFHENQLVYPVRKQSTRNKNSVGNKEQRDFQYGYNQILTRFFNCIPTLTSDIFKILLNLDSLVGDKIYFNSNYNKQSFLSNINSFLKQTPDFHVKINIKADLEPKCVVLYFPINIDQGLIDSVTTETTLSLILEHFDNEKYSSNFQFLTSNISKTGKDNSIKI